MVSIIRIYRNWAKKVDRINSLIDDIELNSESKTDAYIPEFYISYQFNIISVCMNCKTIYSLDASTQSSIEDCELDTIYMYEHLLNLCTDDDIKTDLNKRIRLDKLNYI